MARASIPLAVALALALAAAFASACATGRRTVPRAGAASSPPLLTHSRADAFARAVNLTAADVPGFSGRAKQSGPQRHERAEGRLFRCAGASPPRARARETVRADLADESSPSFELKHGLIDLGVSSEVGVVRSEALARAEVAAIHSPRVRTCFRRYLDSVLTAGRPHGASVGAVAIEAGNPPAPGASGTFGWRVRASFRLSGVSIPVYLDMLGFVYGPARVTLVSSGALRPFPALDQQRLFALLLSRARTHHL